MKISNIKNALLVFTAATIVGCSSATQQGDSPEAAPETTSAPAPVATRDGTSQYQVERGDSLWAISGKAEIYGNPYQWPLIYKNNSSQITDADLIYPGQVFTIDNNPSSSEVNAAVQHARTRGRWSLGVVEESDKDYLRSQ